MKIKVKTPAAIKKVAVAGAKGVPKKVTSKTEPRKSKGREILLRKVARVKISRGAPAKIGLGKSSPSKTLAKKTAIKKAGTEKSASVKSEHSTKVAPKKYGGGKTAAAKRSAPLTPQRKLSENTGAQNLLFAGMVVISVIFGTLGYWQSQSKIISSSPGPDRVDHRSVAEVAPLTVNPVFDQTTTVSKIAPLDSEFAKLKARSRAERVAFWGHLIVNQWNKLQPTLHALVQGNKIEDTVPLIAERLDCTTFVEIVAALSQSEDARQFAKNLILIRYKDPGVNYFSRNHFPEADWIPNNIRAGVIADITATVASTAQVEIRSVSKVIERGKWYASQKAQQRIPATANESTSAAAHDTTSELRPPAEWSKPVSVDLSYIDLQDVDKIAGLIPSGTVINFVRSAHPGRPVLISHQGLITQEGIKTRIRHANTQGTLKSEELAHYVASLRRNPSRVWPVIGISLTQLR